MYLPFKIVKVVSKMSFPPGPPLHLPGMPPVPPMLPPPYAVSPMGGMIPMTVGMMPAPMMAPVAMTMPTPIMPPHHKMGMKKINTNMQNTVYRKENHFESSSIAKGPPVTVFVGNITERAQDNLVRQILQRCGIVFNWKRVQGANGKLQAFGFCEYGDPESALRAIRLLHDWEIGGKKLVVKVDAKTKEKLDEYKAKMLAKQDGEDKEGKDSEKEEGEASDEPLDEMTKQRDEIIKSAIQGILKAHEIELSKPVEEREPTPPPIIMNIPEKIVQQHQHKSSSGQEGSPKISNYDRTRQNYERHHRKNELDEMDMEEDKKSLIHREIDKFRDTYQRAEEDRDKEKERDRDRGDRDRRTSRRRDYESPEPRTRDRDRERDRDNKRYHRERSVQNRDDSLGSSRSIRRRRSRERIQRSPVRTSPIRETRERSRERTMVERSRSASQDKDWSRDKEHSSESRTKDKEWDKEEEDEAYERKKIERKLREKETIYQERLRNWESRERRRGKEYEKERSKNEDQKRDEMKEARRLKEFLEDYDDERDDPKYFKGSALLRRMKEREKEIEEDLLDRQKEKEELDELRKKLTEEGHPDPEAEVERFLQEESRLAEAPMKEITPESDHEVVEKQPPASKLKPLTKVPTTPPPPPEAPEVNDSDQQQQPQIKTPVQEDENTQNSFTGFSDLVSHEEAKPLGFTSLRIGGSPTHPSTTTPATVGSPAPAQNNVSHNTKRKLTVDEVFNANDDETEQKKKRKLIPLDDSQEDSFKTTNSVSQMTLEEKRKHIKNLIEKIPTEKSELFAYSLDWTVVDKVLMEKRIRPWINKKIIEYIGEEEPTLVEFICSKVMAGSAAQSILDDVSMVLDEEAEVFVVKMWRLLIYEIEAKKLGLQESLAQGKS